MIPSGFLRRRSASLHLIPAIQPTASFVEFLRRTPLVTRPGQRRKSPNPKQTAPLAGVESTGLLCSSKISENTMETDENTTEAWKRFVAAMEALTGIKPSRGDSTAAYHFRIWHIGYLAGVTDSETKRRISQA